MSENGSVLLGHYTQDPQKGIIVLSTGTSEQFDESNGDEWVNQEWCDWLGETAGAAYKEAGSETDDASEKPEF
jgi:hypothetical protein